MKKVIVIVASFALVAAGFTPAAQANSQKTLVIIDSGIAAELPFAKEMIIEAVSYTHLTLPTSDLV